MTENQNQVTNEGTMTTLADSVPSSTSLYCGTSPSFGFSEKTKKTDLTLVVGGKNVYVTRAVLELMSSTFQTLLEADEDASEIQLDDKDASQFVEFLACFYPGKGHKVTKDNVFKMLPLAAKYDIVHVFNQCEVCLQTFLQSKETTTDIFLKAVGAVYNFKLVNLKEECLQALEKRPLDDVLHAADADNTPIEAKADVYTVIVPKLIKDVFKYRYLHAGLSKKKTSKLDALRDVNYFTITMEMKADVVGEQNSESVEKLDKTWAIKVSRYMSKGILGTFNVYIICKPNQKTTFDPCDGLLTIIVKNNIPWKDHVIKEMDFVMKAERFETPSIRIEEPSVFDKDAGYLIDKHYTIEANILVNEPQFEEKA